MKKNNIKILIASTLVVTAFTNYTFAKDGSVRAGAKETAKQNISSYSVGDDGFTLDGKNGNSSTISKDVDQYGGNEVTVSTYVNSTTRSTTIENTKNAYGTNGVEVTRSNGGQAFVDVDTTNDDVSTGRYNARRNVSTSKEAWVNDGKVENVEGESRSYSTGTERTFDISNNNDGTATVNRYGEKTGDVSTTVNTPAK